MTSAKLGELCDLSNYPDDWEGVVPIYKPLGPARGRIFAFPDIEGSWKRSWCHPTADQTEPIFWLRDFLPSAFPHCGIYSVGYGHRDCGPPDDIRAVTPLIQQHLKYTPLDQRAPLLFITFGSGNICLKLILLELSGRREQAETLTSSTPELDRIQGVIFLNGPQTLMDGRIKCKLLFRKADRRLEVAEILQKREHEIEGVSSDFDSLVGESLTTIIDIMATTPAKATLINPTPKDDTALPSKHVVSEHVSYIPSPIIDDPQGEAYLNMVRWIKRALGVVLDQDRTWHRILISHERRNPFDAEFASNLDITQILPEWSIGPYPALKTRWPIWAHFPANNEVWMTTAMRFMDAGVSPRHGFRPTAQALGSVVEAPPDLSSSRYVLPKLECLIKPLNHGSTKNYYASRRFEIRVFLPYLHWDTVARFQAYEKAISSNNLSTEAGFSSSQGFIISKPAEKSLRLFHPRRSLNKLYYSRMSSVQTSDDDQVISRQTSNHGLLGGPRMVVSDQLWLCLTGKEVKGKEEDAWTLMSSSIVTSFPSSTYTKLPKDLHNIFCTLDIKQDVLADGDNPDHTYAPPDLTARILRLTMLGLLSIHDDWSLDIFELFRSAIRHAAENQREFSRELRNLFADSGKTIDITQKRSQLTQTHMVANIIEELSSLRTVLETQQSVLLQAPRKLAVLDAEWVQLIKDTLSEIVDKLSDDFLPQILRMERDCKRIQQALLSAFDLLQKEESIRENSNANRQALFTAKQALSAQNQADATNAQSVILFVFAAITAVFLPLSFFPTYFGMYNITGGPESVERSHVNYVMWGFSGLFIGISLFGTALWLYLGQRLNCRNRIQELAKLLNEGNLPSGLVDENSQMYQDILAEKQNITRGTQLNVTIPQPAPVGTKCSGVTFRSRGRQTNQGDHSGLERGLN